MAPRRRLGRRRLLSWWGSLRLWCGSLRLWCGSFLLSWGGQRLFCSRWRGRDRWHEWLYRRWGDLWRRIRRDVPHWGRPDQCGEHRAVFARYRPALSVVFGTTDHARGGAYQGGDHCILSMYAPRRHSHHLRRRSRDGSTRSYAYTAVAARPQSAGLRESAVVIHGYNQLQFASLHAPAASIVAASVDSISGRTGDTEEMGILPCAPTSPASQTLC